MRKNRFDIAIPFYPDDSVDALKYGINLYVNEYCIDSYLDNIISFIPQMK
jgi:hypothetical protein